MKRFSVTIGLTIHASERQVFVPESCLINFGVWVFCAFDFRILDGRILAPEFSSISLQKNLFSSVWFLSFSTGACS
jgi:hypothetical protein